MGGRNGGASGSFSISGMGSIERLDRNRWRIRVSLGREPVTGKYRRSPSITVHGTKSDAINELTQYRARLQSGDAPFFSGAIPTVAEYARQFHEQREGAMGSPLSYKREGIEIGHIERYFPAYPLPDLTPAIIRATYAHLRKGRIMSESGIHKLHQKLSQVMKQAVIDEYITRNPCDAVSAPRPKAKERNSLDADEAARLYAICMDPPMTANKVAVMLALNTGMRRGEVLGLTWKYVDFENNRLYIAYQYAADGKLRAPKSESSKRWVSFSEEMGAYLAQWKAEQKRIFAEIAARDTAPNTRRRKTVDDGGDGVADSVAAANIDAADDNEAVSSDASGNFNAAKKPDRPWKKLKQTDSSPVISNELGSFCDPNIFARWFRNFCVEYGFGTYGETEHFVDEQGRKRIRRNAYQGLNFHELRHTQATLLIGNGADIKTVQHRLGHSSASLTMNIYAHAIEQNDREAADAIGGILTRKPTDK